MRALGGGRNLRVDVEVLAVALQVEEGELGAAVAAARRAQARRAAPGAAQQRRIAPVWRHCAFRYVSDM